MATSSKRALRILVAEDEDVIANICRRALASEGFEVDVAANGKIAQHMARNNGYALFLIDIKMPIMSGKEFFHWLHKKQPRLASRVAFISGDLMAQTTGTFLQESGKPFLPKPFTPDELRSFVRQSLVECQCLV